MSLAQELYESGLITYMRTDSPTLSTEAQQAMAAMITQQYGADYLLSAGTKKGKATPKNAQEAHEAIRPALNEGRFRDPASVSVESTNARALYELIYRRTLASAMRPSKTESVTVSIKASKAADEAMMQSSMSAVVDPGYLLCVDPVAYRDFSTKQSSKAPSSGGGPLTGLKKGSRLSLAQDHFTSAAARTSSSSAAVTSIVADDETSDDQDSSSDGAVDSDPDGVPSSASTMALNTISGALKCTAHATRPPSRFTEASFIKELEARGVGRPSTYSAILAVLKERGYIMVDRQTIVPTGIGLIVARYLRRFFPDIVDDSFTANMEATLDRIATGTEDKLSFLRRYFLADDTGLFQKVQKTIDEAAHSQQGTRSLEIPSLKHLGELAVYNGALFFRYHRPPPSVNGPADATMDSSTDKTSMIRRRLPPSLEQDLRLWTVEAFEALRGDLSAISHVDGADLGVGVAKHDQRPYRFFLKNGAYGPFLHMELQSTSPSANETTTTTSSPSSAGKKRKTAASSTTLNKPMPAWVNESLTVDDAIDFADLPTTIGVYPDTQTNMTLSLRQGHLVITADGYDFEAIVPPHTYVREVTVDEASAALRASSSPRAQAAVRVIGRWNDEDIVLGVGRFGPYARWKAVFASLNRWKDSLDALNVDEVILELQKKLQKTKAGKKTKTTAADTATATAATETKEAKQKRRTSSAKGTETETAAALEASEATTKAGKTTRTKKATKTATDGEEKKPKRTRATSSTAAAATKTAAKKKTTTTTTKKKKVSAAEEAGSD
jgi:DNA topoisomerase-1